MAQRNAPSVAQVWETRFHRLKDGDSPTKNWVFFISRPTLEALRRADHEGKKAFITIKQQIEVFLDEQPSALQFRGDFSVQTHVGKGRDPASTPYVSFAYPFDVSEELRARGSHGKLGVYVHYGISSTSDIVEEDNVSIPLKKASMFDKAFISEIEEKLERPKTPPKIGKADPMWMEFSSGKILPTDVLRATEEEHWRTFQQLICSQFMEIRLIQHSKDMTNAAIREQVDALRTFSSFESGYSNFAGAPGTGKSTLLHMICAHQLYVDEEILGEEKKVLYYVASSYLKNEARREIERILQYIYFFSERPKQGEIVTAEVRDLVRDKIVFCAQEDLFQINKPSYDTNIITGDDKNIARSLGINENDTRFGEKINTFKRQLRQVIFGLFGEEEHYRIWSRRNEKKLRSAWQNQKLSLVNPRDAQSQEHNISMERFISFDKEYDQFNKYLQKIRKDIFDGTYKHDAYWDPSSVVIHSSKNYSENSIWAKHKGKIDQIIIDEIQDIAMSEVSLLLNHFSNRQHENPIADFRFIGAGDENQSIKFLEYFPNNEHMNSLFKDWATSIRVQISKPSGVSLSHGLTPTQQESLVSSYRIPNVMVAYVRELLQHLRQSADMELKTKHRSKPTKLKKAPFGREGILLVDDLRLKTSAADKQSFSVWGERLLGQLEQQLLNDSDGPPKIAVIFDEYDWNDACVDSGHGLHDYFSDKTEHATLAQPLSDLIGESVEKIRNELSDQGIPITSTEIKTGLASKGVMSVKAIQGLTVPIAIVLPPSKIRPIEHLEDLRNNMPNISKFLVGITRAQYLNLILTDTRVFQQQTRAIDSELEHQRVTDWLNNVLENSMGLTIPYSDLFERTLREYQAFTAWNELESRTHQMAEDNNLMMYFETMKEFHQVGLPQKSLTLNSNIWSDIESNIKQFQIVEETFGLQKRLHASVIPSLKLFAVSNIMIRQGENSTITAQIFAKLFEEWVDNDNSDGAFADTNNWLNLLVPPPEGVNLATYYSGNRLYQDINALFGGQGEQPSAQSISSERKWPRQQLPQLNMEGWRLVNKKTEEEHDDLAWMQPDSALYTVPQRALSLVIENRMGQEQISEEFKELSIKLWLYLSMTLDDAEMFCRAYVNGINQQQTWLIDWYVNLHQSFSSDHEQFFQQFQHSLENNIISNTSPSNPVKDELSNYFAASENIHQFQQRLRAFSFEQWDKSTNFLDMFQRIVEITYHSLDELQINPFAPGEYVHKYIKSHEDELADLHRKMFYTLFATQEAIRTGRFSTHIAKNNVEVPFVFGGNQELETAFIQCLNKWSTLRDESIQQLEAELVSLIAPAAQQDSKKQQTLNQWLTYFVSLKKQERTAGDNNRIQHNLLRKLQKSGGGTIVQEFLGYALNPQDGYRTNLSKERLKDYMGGKAANLIYMLRTNDVEPPFGGALVNLWKEILTSASTYIGNPDTLNKAPTINEVARIKGKRFGTFSEMFRTTHDGLLAEECGILRLKWLHRPIHVARGFDRDYAALWAKGRVGQKIKVPLPFCSNATFAALAHLADSEILMSADCFEEAGLFNHAFALRVNEVYDDLNDSRPDLVRTIAGLIRRDTFAGDNILYLDIHSRSPINTTLSEYKGAKEEGDDYHYGLSRSFIREQNMTLLDREIYQTDSPANLKLSLKPSNEHYPYVLFFEHREWVKNNKLIRDSLEAIDKDVTDNNQYLSRMKKFHSGPWKSKTWSFRHRGLEANNNDKNDSETAISSIVFEYGMDTLDNQAKRGMKGYVPVKKSRHQQAPGKDNLVKFLLHVLNKNHLNEERSSFASRLAKLTGVSGATLVHLLPKAASMSQTMEEMETMMRDEEESENRRQMVKQRISEILSDENLPDQRKYLLKAIMDKLDGGAPNEAIETVNDLGEMILKRIDVVNNILQVLKEL